MSPAFSFVARYLPARTPPLKLFVATTDVLPFQVGMSLSISTTLTPAARALFSAGTTAALVGVIAMPLTPWATRFWIAAISPASSVPLLPWAKSTFAPGCALSHFFAAFSRVKKKSTGNLVMKPSFTVSCFLVGVAVALVASKAVAASTVAKTTPPKSLFFHIVRPFVKQSEFGTGTLHSSLTSAPAALQ